MPGLRGYLFEVSPNLLILMICRIAESLGSSSLKISIILEFNSLRLNVESEISSCMSGPFITRKNPFFLTKGKHNSFKMLSFATARAVAISNRARYNLSLAISSALPCMQLTLERLSLFVKCWTN